MHRSIRPELTPKEILARPITSHAAGAIAFQFTQDPVRRLTLMEFLNMNYTDHKRRDRVSVRVPLGKGDPGEGFAETVDREFREEIAKRETEFDIDVFNLFPVYVALVQDEDHQDGIHLKAFVVVGVRSVQLRDYIRKETDGSETHGPLRFTEAKTLIENGVGGIPLFHTHRPPIIKTLEMLGGRLPEVWQSYGDHLHTLGREERIPQELDSRIRAKIERYIVEGRSL